MSKNKTPTRIRTTGPAMERAGRGAITGLAMTHLTRRRRNRSSAVRCRAGPRAWGNTGSRSSRTLQQLRSADHKQDDRPGTVKVRYVQLGKEKENAECSNNGRTSQAS